MLDPTTGSAITATAKSPAQPPSPPILRIDQLQIDLQTVKVWTGVNMYLAQLSITNFRRLSNVTLEFRAGLNVIVGPNNIGKTAVVDALRALLAGADDPYPRFALDDLHLPSAGGTSGEIRFEYVFRGLEPDDEADFLHALRTSADGKHEAVLGVTYGEADRSGRLRARRWCGEFNDVAVTPTILAHLIHRVAEAALNNSYVTS